MVPIQQELTKWGMNVTQNVDEQYCSQLYDAMVRNYPCMREGICTPYSDTTIVIVLVIALLLAVAGGYYLHKVMVEHDNNK